MTRAKIEDVKTTGEVIRLGQFLKLANLVESGADAGELVRAGEVFVNGRPETRRGRQLSDRDVVRCAGTSARVLRG